MVCDRSSRPPSSSSFSNSFNEEVMKGDSCGGCERKRSTCLGAAVVVAAAEEEVVVVVVVCSITMTMMTQHYALTSFSNSSELNSMCVLIPSTH